jgi:hypothetical protein
VSLAVSFSGRDILAAAWPSFLDGGGIHATEPDFAARIRALQVIRMLELLAADTLAPDIARIVADRLHATLALGQDGG